MRTFAVVAAAALGQLAGCYTFRVVDDFQTTKEARLPVPVEHVELLYPGQLPTRPPGAYEERGVASVTGKKWLFGGPGKPLAPGADLFTELREVGAGAGCDALLLTPITDPPRHRSTVSLSATCIVYTDGGSAALTEAR